MKPSDFTGKAFASFKGRYVNIPVYSLTGKWTYVEQSVIHAKPIIKQRIAVLIEPLYYLGPGRPIKESLPIVPTRIESKKN